MNINPFSEFWVNCDINNKISVLSSYESSYINIILCNDYKYNYFFHEQSKSMFLGIDFFTTTKNKAYFDNIQTIPKCYNNRKNILEELKLVISEGNIALPKVDLYYWNKKGLGYGQWVSYHYTLLIEYNFGLKEFVALEDDLYSNYGLISESEYDLLKSINSAHDTKFPGPDYYVMTVNDNISKYNFNVLDMLTNIRMIIKSIHLLKFYRLFNFKNEVNQTPSTTQLQALVISKIATRMKINVKLVKILEAKGLISDKTYKECIELFQKCETNYILIKNILMKGHYKSIDYFVREKRKKLNKILIASLKLELKAWNIIKKELIKVDKNICIF